MKNIKNNLMLASMFMFAQVSLFGSVVNPSPSQALTTASRVAQSGYSAIAKHLWGTTPSTSSNSMSTPMATVSPDLSNMLYQETMVPTASTVPVQSSSSISTYALPTLAATSVVAGVLASPAARAYAQKAWQGASSAVGGMYKSTPILKASKSIVTDINNRSLLQQHGSLLHSVEEKKKYHIALTNLRTSAHEINSVGDLRQAYHVRLQEIEQSYSDYRIKQQSEISARAIKENSIQNLNESYKFLKNLVQLTNGFSSIQNGVFKKTDLLRSSNNGNQKNSIHDQILIERNKALATLGIKLPELFSPSNITNAYDRETKNALQLYKEKINEYNEKIDKVFKLYHENIRKIDKTKKSKSEIKRLKAAETLKRDKALKEFEALKEHEVLKRDNAVTRLNAAYTFLLEYNNARLAKTDLKAAPIITQRSLTPEEQAEFESKAQYNKYVKATNDSDEQQARIDQAAFFEQQAKERYQQEKYKAEFDELKNELLRAKSAKSDIQTRKEQMALFEQRAQQLYMQEKAEQEKLAKQAEQAKAVDQLHKKGMQPNSLMVIPNKPAPSFKDLKKQEADESRQMQYLRRMAKQDQLVTIEPKIADQGIQPNSLMVIPNKPAPSFKDFEKQEADESRQMQYLRRMAKQDQLVTMEPKIDDIGQQGSWNYKKGAAGFGFATVGATAVWKYLASKQQAEDDQKEDKLTKEQEAAKYAEQLRKNEEDKIAAQQKANEAKLRQKAADNMAVIHQAKTRLLQKQTLAVTSVGLALAGLKHWYSTSKEYENLANSLKNKDFAEIAKLLALSVQRGVKIDTSLAIEIWQQAVEQKNITSEFLALMSIALMMHMDEFKEFVTEKNIDINKIDTQGQTVLSRAIALNNLDLVQKIIGAGATVGPEQQSEIDVLQNAVRKKWYQW